MLHASRASTSKEIDQLYSTMPDLSISTCERSSLSAEHLLNETIYQRIAHIEQFPQILGLNDSFFVADIEEIRRQHNLWVSHLHHIRPFYGNMKLILFCVLLD